MLKTKQNLKFPALASC